MTSSAIPTYFQTMSPAPPSQPQPTSTSASAPTPQPSALPPSQNPAPSDPHNSDSHPEHHDEISPSKFNHHRKPLLRLELRDLSSRGTQTFLRLLHASHALETAVNTVVTHLYSDLPRHCVPPTRSITLVLRAMDGVAQTSGRDIDNDHKVIEFNTSYIESVPESRVKEEMLGVITHEMVHCWQHNGHGSAPGGLIEGIADWVRLKAGLGPPHWKRVADGKWDAGYERTAYFLEWLEEVHCGEGIVRHINDALRTCEKYDEKEFWMGCCGESIKALWKEYQGYLADPEEKGHIRFTDSDMAVHSSSALEHSAQEVLARFS